MAHALLWIGAYVATVYVGDALSASFGMRYVVTALLLMGLSLVAAGFVGSNGWTGFYGLRWPHRSDLNGTWLYLPLAAIVGMQFVKGIDPTLVVADVVWLVGLMLCVGFLEELIFRGFLFTAVRDRSTVHRAVIISGLTFGVGHIVNLGRGMSLANQALQIAVGIALGFVLALLFALTRTIIPAIVFHVLLNISGNITGDSSELELLVVAVSVLIAMAYAVHLWRRLPAGRSTGNARGTAIKQPTG